MVLSFGESCKVVGLGSKLRNADLEIIQEEIILCIQLYIIKVESKHTAFWYYTGPAISTDSELTDLIIYDHQIYTLIN